MIRPKFIENELPVAMKCVHSLSVQLFSLCVGEENCQRQVVQDKQKKVIHFLRKVFAN